MAQTASADVVKAKVMMVAMAAMALATVVSLLASLVFSFMAGAAILSARAALMAVWHGLVASMRRLAALSAKQLALKAGAGLGVVGWQAVKFGAAGAGIMGGWDLSIQAGQVGAGKRAELDGKSLMGSFVGGFLGGAFAGVFHAGAVWVRGGRSRVGRRLRRSLRWRRRGRRR
ncbi:hypothetical protein DMC64_37000 [Amycolatopsis sp. WAC 04197]|nr:hypothetical protein DMC64_37000 [Amycolatopsis sp. WAC 04197]